MESSRKGFRQVHSEADLPETETFSLNFLCPMLIGGKASPIDIAFWRNLTFVIPAVQRLALPTPSAPEIALFWPSAVHGVCAAAHN